MNDKYCEYFIDWLVEEGYTTCFFVAGGNIMHLLAAARHRLECVPVVHEVSAAIAAEYFNQHSTEGRAFAMVTAGPGLTNAATGVAGAWLESRELLVVGGQVKSTDLSTPGMRQRGIQEIGGVALMSSITKASVLVDTPLTREEVHQLCELSRHGRRGPVFIEMCLDVQAMPFEAQESAPREDSPVIPVASDELVNKIAVEVSNATRPVFLIGGGVSREVAERLRHSLDALNIPILTSWNGADRFASDNSNWFGRPDTWGMRFSNIIMQQADVLVAFGARLSLQQTGFNWQSFIPCGRVIQVDIDESETSKGHPHVDLVVNADVNDLLPRLLPLLSTSVPEWIAHCRLIREELPVNDPENVTSPGYVSPYEFSLRLAELCDASDAIVPCSSGGANTVMMQSFLNKTGQIFFNDKALASMGYGLAGAIGASLAHRGRRTVLVEGDGGFSQNSQELATVSVQNCNLKMFIFSNQGYASIRMTQRNYFGGDYVGCDTSTGLGFPNWSKLADAYGIAYLQVEPGFEDSPSFRHLWNSSEPCFFEVMIDPEQTYFPKINSRVTETGGMESAPLHAMSPALSDNLRQRLLKYMPAGQAG